MSRPMHVLTGPRVPESTWSPFLCEHFHGTLTGGECLRRQTKRTKASAQCADKSPRVPPHLEFCASGDCEQGAEVAKKFPDWKPEDRPPKWNWPPPTPAVEELKRECADVVLSMKKPSWATWKAAKAQERAQEPSEPKEEVEHEPHPLSKRGMEKQMAEVKLEEVQRRCAEPGCTREDRLTKGLCGMHYQRARNAQKDRKRHRLAAAALTGQDEFDTMIRIRDDFRRLSAAGRRYVLDALKGGR